MTEQDAAATDVRALIASGMDGLLIVAERCFKSQKEARAGLILLYSAIDILASTNRPETQEYVQRKDFIVWMETYLLPGSGLECNGIDLYSARCGLLHSYSSESQSTHTRKAREIFYAWGNQRPGDLQDLVPLYSGQFVTVHVNDLLSAVRGGIQRFANALEGDSDRLALVSMRVRKWLAPTDPQLVHEAKRLLRREGQ